MATEYQVIDKIAHDAELRSIGDSIRAKGGTTAPFNSAAEMAAAVDAIQTGGSSFSWGDWGAGNVITEINAPDLTTLKAGIFTQQKVLKKVTLPNMKESFGAEKPFYRCSALETVEMPKFVKDLDNSFFRDCGKLKEIILPSYNGRIDNSAFEGCTSLARVDINTCSNLGINVYAFMRCTSLTVFIIRSPDHVVKLNNKDAFANTPIKNGTGYIYVPKVLTEQYKAATNWSNYASQIRAIEDYPDITGG